MTYQIVHATELKRIRTLVFSSWTERANGSNSTNPFYYSSVTPHEIRNYWYIGRPQSTNTLELQPMTTN